MAKIKADAKEKMNSLGSVLSYRRAVEITDGAMFSGKDMIVEYGHGMRTTKGYDTTKKNGEVINDNGGDISNLSYVKMAKLSSNEDTLVIKFGTTFIPIAISPELTDSSEKKKLFENKNKELVDSNSLNIVAKYYAYKILNGSWGWRNRDVANKINVIAKFDDVLIENNIAREMPLHPILTTIQKENGVANPLTTYADKIESLSIEMAKAFRGEREPLSVSIEGIFKMSNGSSVFPSQLFLPTKLYEEKSVIGRVFYKVPFNKKGVEQVGITAEKINNALRKFDLLDDGQGNESIISIEPNGSDITTRKAFRGSGKRLIDLYTAHVFSSEKLELEDEIFLIGMLIRGGLFNEGSENKKKED